MPTRTRGCHPFSRRPRFEPLEERRLLANVTVGNTLDVVNGNTSSIAALIANNGGDGISLREAILAANASGGTDEIRFDASLSGQGISLNGSELSITQAVTIDARPLAQNVIINANQQSRVLLIGSLAGNVSLGGLTITGGRTTGDNDLPLFDYRGGGIASLTSGNVTFNRCTISGNSTWGDYAQGGGLMAVGDITLNQCIVSGNSTAGIWGFGGGVRSFGDITLNESTVSGNSTAGPAGYGGGISAMGDVTLHQTTIVGNTTTGTGRGSGGGISARGKVALTNSVVSGNSTMGDGGNGGGIYSVSDVTLTQSTVSGNHTFGDLSFIFSSRGGGIFSGANVMLTQSGVTGNSTAGISAFGGGISALNVTLIDSTVSANNTAGSESRGGGIETPQGNVVLIRSTVSGNSTTGPESPGGGIWADEGTVTLTESTVSGNSTSGSDSPGGGISAYAGGLTLINSTVSGNHTAGPNASGGGIYALHATLTQSTITDNHATHATSRGGGVYQPNSASNAPLSLSGSIVAGNTAGGPGTDLVKDIGSTLTVNFSLIGTGIVPDLGGNNVITNSPLLSPLSENGGPTLTHALLAGSPAIDMGDFASALANDQRGAPFNRIFGSRIDIGAYERQTLAAESLVVTTAADESDYTNGDVSLREAVNSAAGSIGSDTVTFASSLSGKVITLEGTELKLVEAITIDARPLATNVTIDADQSSRIFNITATTGNFFFGGLTLMGGLVTGNNAVGETTFSGGAIRSLTTGSLTLDQTTLSGNRTVGNRARGGAIFAAGNLSLMQSTVSGNSTSGVGAHGGGVFATGTASLNRSTISGNIASGEFSDGGGVYAAGNANLSTSSVSDNSTTANNSRGGGIWVYGNPFLFSSTVSGNSTIGTNSRGGGMYISGEAVQTTIEQSTISGNSTAGAGASGGGIAAPRGNLLWLNISTLSGNRTTGANAFGGGLWARGGVFSLAVTQSTVTDNHALQATSKGGGIFQIDSNPNHPFSIENSIVAGNTAAGGDPDVVKDPQSTLTANYSMIGTAVAPNSGGNNIVTNTPSLAPLAHNGGPTQTHALLAGNTAIDKGDPAIVFDPAESDQRRAPFVRVFDGDGVMGARIDIGAYERQSVGDANLVVDNPSDEYNGLYSAGDLTLREVIVMANVGIGPNAITFAPALFGATITLGGTELEIKEALTIDARPLAQNVTIHANQLSRIFNITATTGNFYLAGLTLTGGRTTAFLEFGGAIRSATNGTLTIEDSTITGNSTTGLSARGGAIRATGPVVIGGTTISGNSTAGTNAIGGAIAVSFTGSVTVTGSTISGNSTHDIGSPGGGIYSLGPLTVTNSTISGNSTAASHGGGIYASFGVTLDHSTVTGNSVTGGNGGGVYSYSGPVTIRNSIVAGNVDTDNSHPDLRRAGTFTLQFSLIGDNNGTGLTPAPIGMPDGNGNLIGTHASIINPLLGPLADNGGPTPTHALLGSSPAIDKGDPAAVAGGGNVPLFDQRGAPFTRVYNGDAVPGARIDIGAFEVQPTPAGPALPGDYNQNNVVDAADYVLWRNALNQSVTPFSGADGDGDGTVDQDDYGVWRARFGQTSAAGSMELGAGSGVGGGSRVEGLGSRARVEESRVEGQESRAAEVRGKASAVSSAETETRAQRGSAGRATVQIVAPLENPRSKAGAVLASSAAVAARRDDALLAWLAAGKSELQAIDVDEVRRIARDTHATDEIDLDALDATFAALVSTRSAARRG